MPSGGTTDVSRLTGRESDRQRPDAPMTRWLLRMTCRLLRDGVGQGCHFEWAGLSGLQPVLAEDPATGARPPGAHLLPKLVENEMRADQLGPPLHREDARDNWMPPSRLGHGAVVAHFLTSSMVASGSGAVE